MDPSRAALRAKFDAQDSSDDEDGAVDETAISGVSSLYFDGDPAAEPEAR